MASGANKIPAPLSVVIAGGGTGGHLYPGIAVARELVARDPRTGVTFVGTARGVEQRIVPREGFALDLIRSAGLRGKSLPAATWALAQLPLSAVDAWRVLSRRLPQLVIGVGGYSSGPVVALAALRGIPTMVLEQNAVPGFTNRRLARLVRAAAVTYEASLPYFGGKGFVSGNPVRPEFVTAASAPRAGAEGAPRVLIFGGSQGAHAINVAMVEAAPRLAVAPDRMSITHQAGEGDLEMVRVAYERAGLAVRVEPFLYAMDREMIAADLVVCRAGATTIAELTAIGRAAILVPLPSAADDHQRRNAAALVRAGAAAMLEQRTLTGERLADAILDLLRDRGRRDALAAAARRFGRPDAARVIVDRALALVGRA